jgi:hypothetical protein
MMSRIVVDFPDPLGTQKRGYHPRARGKTQIIQGERVTVALGEILRLDHLSSWPTNAFGAQDGPRS